MQKFSLGFEKKKKKKKMDVSLKKKKLKKQLNEANKKRQRVDTESAGDTPQGDRARAQK